MPRKNRGILLRNRGGYGTLIDKNKRLRRPGRDGAVIIERAVQELWTF